MVLFAFVLYILGFFLAAQACGLWAGERTFAGALWAIRDLPPIRLPPEPAWVTSLAQEVRAARIWESAARLEARLIECVVEPAPDADSTRSERTPALVSRSLDWDAMTDAEFERKRLELDREDLLSRARSCASRGEIREARSLRAKAGRITIALRTNYS